MLCIDLVAQRLDRPAGFGVVDRQRAAAVEAVRSGGWTVPRVDAIERAEEAGQI